jgi:hypothetical protein
VGGKPPDGPFGPVVATRAADPGSMPDALDQSPTLISVAYAS